MPADEPPPLVAGQTEKDVRNRRTALIIFWVALGIALLNPPGAVAAFFTLVATAAAVWMGGIWLNRFWRLYVKPRL